MNLVKSLVFLLILLIYLDSETAEYAEYLRTRPSARLLFSASRGISKEDMEKAVEYIELLKLKHNK